MLDGLKGTNVLVLDSGNALFRNAGVATDADKLRASFILDAYAKLGVKAMAAGQRDLSAGVEFLETEAKRAGVKVLSANLVREGKLVFEPSTIIDAGGVKVAVIGLTAVGPVVPNVKTVYGDATVEAAKKALKGLGKRDLTVILAATSYADSLQLAQQLKDDVDFVIQSGEYRGAQPAQKVDGSNAWVLASAQKGQALAKLQLALGAGKTFLDLSTSDRDKQQLDFVSKQIKTLEDRIKAAKDKTAAADLNATLASLRQRRAELQKAADTKVAPNARTLKLDWVVLSSDVKDDPAMKAEVLKIDPAYEGAH